MNSCDASTIKGLAQSDLALLKIGNLFLTSHEIIQSILKNLNYCELLTAIQVCQAWCNVGQSLLKNKRRLRFTTIHPENQPTTDLSVAKNKSGSLPAFEALENFLEENSSKASHCIGFTCGGWLYRDNIVTKHSSKGTNLSHLFSSVLPSECELALVSASGVIGSVERPCPPGTSFFTQISKEREQRSHSLSSISHHICLEQRNAEDELLANSSCSCEAWQGERGSIGYPQDANDKVVSFNNVGYSIELEEAAYREVPVVDMEAVSLLLLPKQPGVRIKIFNFDEKDFIKTHRPNATEQHKRIGITDDEFNFICGLNSEDDLKAFLVFTHTYRSLTRSLIDAAQSRHNGKVAIGGGLIEILQQRGDLFSGTIAVAISGNNLKAASIVVPSSVKCEVSLKGYLQKLKDQGLPEGHSVCFLFSCCGRGSRWYARSRPVTADEFCNIETRAFREFFPHTPIFGFFGDGEIGTNSYLYEEEAEGQSGNDRKRRKKKQNPFHQYSSVFVFVSFL